MLFKETQQLLTPLSYKHKLSDLLSQLYEIFVACDMKHLNVHYCNNVLKTRQLTQCFKWPWRSWLRARPYLHQTFHPNSSPFVFGFKSSLNSNNSSVKSLIKRQQAKKLSIFRIPTRRPRNIITILYKTALFRFFPYFKHQRNLLKFKHCYLHKDLRADVCMTLA